MKSIILFACFTALIVCLISASKGFAQQPAGTGNIFVVTTYEFSFPEGGRPAEFDSLTQLYTDNVTRKNDLILSFHTLRHWWGHNNRDLVTIFEVKDWGDVEKASAKETELFEKAFSTKEQRDAFNKAYRRYLTGKHSDEIYAEVKSGKK